MGTPLFFLSYLLNYYLRNDDNQVLASRGFTVGNFADLGLNIVFVLGLNLGVVGAALATILGNVISIVLYLPGLFGKSHALRYTPCRPSLSEPVRAFSLGSATSIQYIYQLFFYLIVNHVLIRGAGENGVAIFNIVQNVSYLVLYLYDGVSKASQPLISTYSGERNRHGYQSIFRMAFLSANLLGVVSSAAIALLAPWVCVLFGLEGSELIAQGNGAIHIYCISLVFAGSNILLENYYQALGAELNVATQIQADMLPSIFPAFPNHPEFDIYATMTPAKEVGGDFYDFFLTDDDHLCMVIADVSGKGVPAALFMVIAKTLLKNSAQTGLSPKQILEIVNNQLVEGNKAEMFVTAWVGILQLSTGKLVAANAGHEYPVLKKADGAFELMKDRHGFVLAGMENVRYREYEMQIDAGDVLFVYTDGVPEATNLNNEMFGTQSMLDALNSCSSSHPQHLLAAVKESIDSFVGEAQQFDDITMLALEMKSFTRRYRLNVAPSMDSLSKVAAFVEESLEQEEVPMKAIAKMNIAVDEIFSNIVNYSGATEASIVCFVQDEKVNIRFEDNGVAFDPLSREDPDTTLSAEERGIGGLGIFMVKKSMSHLFYDRRNERNMFTIQLDL